MKHSRRIRLAFLVLSCFLLLILTAHAVTPLLYYSWNESTITYYINPNITPVFGWTITNAIQAGLTSWNTTDAPTISASNSSTSWDVHVDMNDYGETTWVGICDPDVTDLGVYLSSSISINVNGYYGYLNTPDLWKAVTCHEMGHAHGLGHNTTDNEASIMKSSLRDFYDYQSTSPHLTVPQQADISAVNGLY